jgi:hypothetical protein
MQSSTLKLIPCSVRDLSLSSTPKLTINTVMVCSGCNITGVVEVAECNSNTTIIADIVCVKHGEGQVNPESWYCSSTRTWRYPVINGGRASLLARSKIDIQGFGSHGIMDPCEYMMLHRKVLRECHRVFLVVHWLIGPTGQDRRIALNISGYLHYDKSDAQYH